MTSPLNGVLRAASRKEDEPLNILLFPTKRRFDQLLMRTNNKFHLVEMDNCVWSKEMDPVLPKNAVLYSGGQMPIDVDFDLIISQDTVTQFQKARELSFQLHVPLLSIHHSIKSNILKSEKNVFISQILKDVTKMDGEIIPYAVDTELFKPAGEKDNGIACLKDVGHVDAAGAQLISALAQNKNSHIVAPEFYEARNYKRPSLPTANLPTYVYNKSVYVNPWLNTLSYSVIEAMACECAVVSVHNRVLEEYIQHGVNGYLCTDNNSMDVTIIDLIKNPDKARKIGAEARKTVLEKLDATLFTDKISQILRDSANTVFKG